MLGLLLAAPLAMADGMPSGSYSARPFSWTGLYVGVHGGADWLSEKSHFDPLFNGAVNTAAWNRSSESFRQTGQSGVFGLQVGYNYQVGSSFLVGVEWDLSSTRVKGSETVATRTSGGVPFAPVSPAFMSSDVDWLYSARGRLGVVNHNLLVYGTGGFAAADVKNRSHLQSVPPGTNWDASIDGTRTGFVVGGGAEYMISHNLLLRAEYLYYDLAGRTITADGVPANFPGFQIHYAWDHTQIQIARVGLSYLFNTDHYVPLK